MYAFNVRTPIRFYLGLQIKSTEWDSVQ